MHKRIVGIAIALLVCSSTVSAATARWNEFARSDYQSDRLAEVERLVQRTDNPVVIFDLDATLYKNYGRTAAIFQEYGRAHDIRRLAKLKGEDLSQGYVLEDILVDDAGFKPKRAQQILTELAPYWKARFFTNDYIKYDTALPGAVEYVRNLYKQGAYILYVTGRYNDTMRQGTIKRMKRDGFPIGQARTKLIMKPGSVAAKSTSEAKFNKALTASDANYKVVATRTAQKLGTVVATFENSSKQIQNYYRDLHSEGRGVAVWLDTEMHPGENRPQQIGITAIRGFLR